MTSEIYRERHELTWMEPLDAYRLLRHREAILLDGLGAHPGARYAYVALSPVWRLTIRAGQAELETADGVEHSNDTLALLARLADRMHHDVDEPEGFTGGLVGYVGYEALAAIEPTLPVHASGTPDVWLRLCRDVVVFDRQARQAWLWVNEMRDGPEDVAGRAERAERAARIIEDLAQPLDPLPETAASGEWRTSLTQPAFESQVEALKEKILAGDLFQANLATRFSLDGELDPVALYAHLRANNPSPYMCLIEAEDHAVVSCSPEQLFEVRDGRIASRPIAGTRPRGKDADADMRNEVELRLDPKEQAEHTMLVDLLRNDIAKVAVPGTVQVPERMSVERYRHVMHLVSRVEGEVRPGTGFADWLAAMFPGGTITGAPKHRACMRIHEAEPVARGPYTGSAGFLSWSHNAHWNILIRTLVLHNGAVHAHAGSGIVADSIAEREWHEAGHKAQALLEAATGIGRPGGDRLGEVSRHDAWAPRVPGHVADRRVLVIDNYDSFTYNLADYCAALGAQVEVIRNDVPWRDVVEAFAPTHIILSPGPGRPEDSGTCLELLRDPPGVPVLGVCLGHQAMGFVSGADISLVPPVHGKTAAIYHHHTGLVSDLPVAFQAARYHSLVVGRDGLAAEWTIDAWLDDGTIMAMHDAQKQWYGLQFHPESICTDEGLKILERFLAIGLR